MNEYSSSRVPALARLVPIIIGLIVMGVIALRGCREGPFGRSQLITVSAEQELLLGRQAYQQILSKSQVIEHQPINRVVRQIGERLRAASELPSFRTKLRTDPNLRLEWEFRVIQSKQINAFCLPGGKVAVYTGILPIAKTDAGLAVVMGHEIGHALARHGAERMSQNELVKIGQIAVGSALGDMSPQAQRTVMGLFGAGAQVGILLPFSRSHESEADRIGLILMAAAGYDPREGSKFWERMSRATSGGKAPPEFLSTHPAHETRIRDLIKLADDEAMPFFLRSNKAPNEPLPLEISSLPAASGGKSKLKGPGYEFGIRP